MNSIQNFAFEEHLVRVVDRDGEPWFVGKDVCKVLGIQKHHQALNALDEDERGTCIVGTPSGSQGHGGGGQSMITVSEPGVYRLVFRSRKPEAERFKRWLAHEVLPQLRRTGRFEPETVSAPASPTDIPLNAWRVKLDTVREARIQFGPARAAALWDQLGLPPVPVLVENDSDEAQECLAELLARETDDGVIRDMVIAALDGVGGYEGRLRRHGIRISPRADGFIIASSHPGAMELFAHTRWAEGGWFRLLRRLPGASVTPPMKFSGSRVSRGTFIPAELMEKPAP